MKPSGIHILFLDGECLLCRHTAHLLHRFDRTRHIHFSTLQGKTAEFLPSEWRILRDTDGNPSGNAILAEWTENGHYVYWHGANAILRALKLTKSWLSLAWPLYYTPSTCKDSFYELVARKRHQVATICSDCPSPPESFKDASLP